MKRGEIWTASGRSDYDGKPRPAVIIQDDDYDALESVTVCPFTSDPTNVQHTRPEIAPSEHNGLRVRSHLMVDKITTMQKAKLGHRIGRLSDEDIVRLNRALTVFLGIASSTRAQKLR